MTAPLSSLAEVSVGLTLRSPEAGRPSSEGHYSLLKISDVDDFGQVHPDLEHRIKLNDAKAVARHRVQPGDVVLANRGNRAKAGLITQDLPLIAGGQFYIIRIHDSRLLPAYLVWFLNHPETQQALFEESSVSVVQTILAPHVRRLPVLLPPLQTQSKIVEVYRLRAEEQRLVSQIENLKAKQIHAILLKLATTA